MGKINHRDNYEDCSIIWVCRKKSTEQCADVPYQKTLYRWFTEVMCALTAMITCYACELLTYTSIPTDSHLSWFAVPPCFGQTWGAVGYVWLFWWPKVTRLLCMNPRGESWTCVLCVKALSSSMYIMGIILYACGRVCCVTFPWSFSCFHKLAWIFIEWAFLDR